MKFGLMELVSGMGGEPVPEIYANNLELVQLAEELGFDNAWVAEHHFTDYGLVPNTMQYLAAAAQRTERIRLGAAVVVTPLHHPIRIAEETAFLDVLSGGRLEVGVGRGYQPKEFGAFGMSIEDSRARFDESVAFLRKAWTSEEPFDWKGEFYQGEAISILPRTTQQPHPPLWLACVSASTFDIAGRDGWQIMTSPNFTPLEIVKANFARYREALLEAGHDPTSFTYPIMQQVYVAETEAEAYEAPREACMGYFKSLGNLLPTDVKGDGKESGGKDYEQFRKTQRKIADLRYDYLIKESVLFGTPDQLIERLRAMESDIGVSALIGWFNFAGMPQDMVKRSMRLFADEVMPALAESGKVAEPSVA